MMSLVSRSLRMGFLLLLAFLLSADMASPPLAYAATFTVDTLVDEADGSCADGDCSLRDAIALADSAPGPDTITFDVAGVITVDDALGCLPVLVDDQTTIDGTTAPGYADPPGTPVVQITSEPGLSCDGIHIEDSTGNVLRALAIHSFSGDCVSLVSASSNVVGPNMVLSNCSQGISLLDNSDSNTIEGNFIGTGLTGMTAWGNTYQGVTLSEIAGGPSSNEILNNVISGNGSSGILLGGLATTENVIMGNYIGVGADGVTPLGNGGPGIFIASAHHNYIGGWLEGEANIIAYNASAIPHTGIVIFDMGADHNRITCNSIYDNNDLGIDLGDDGPTCDSPDVAGPNDLIPCPVITSATTTLISGTTCPYCIVQAFIADPDPSGYGEGRTYLADTEADGEGNFSIPVSGVEPCDWITATAIGNMYEDRDNTSEFAYNVQVPCEEPTPVHRRPTKTPTPEPTPTPTITLTPVFPVDMIPAPTATPAAVASPVVVPPPTGTGSGGDASFVVLAPVLAAATGGLAAAGLVWRARRTWRNG